MISMQAEQMAEFFASITERMSKTDADLATIRDVYESLHLAASEPEGVSYAEIDADGVPALWCIPAGCDADRVLLHSHGGGTVIFSMHLDRKAAGHIAKSAGVRALVLDYRRSPEHKFPAQIEDVEKAYHWLLAQGIRPDNIAATGQSIGGNLAVSLAVALRNKGAPLPAAILSISPWYDMELRNETIESNSKTDHPLKASVGMVSRDLARWHGCVLERSSSQSAVCQSERTSPNPGLLRRARAFCRRSHRVCQSS